METQQKNKIQILSDLWMNYRDDAEFEDFVAFADLGLPLSYMLDNDIVKGNEMTEKFINETFELFLSGLGIEDTGFDTLDDVFMSVGIIDDDE